jgi:hypothetical protein
MGEPTSCCRSGGGYCDRCDLLVGPDGLRVVGVDRDDGGALTVTVESEPSVMGCGPAGSWPARTRGAAGGRAQRGP